MKLRELIKRTTVLEDVTVSAGATRAYDGSEPEIYVSMSSVGDRCQFFSLDLTREATQNLIADLQAALEVKPYTREQILNHQEHVAFRREKELGYGR